MNSKVLVFLGLVFAVALLISVELAAQAFKDEDKETEAKGINQMDDVKDQGRGGSGQGEGKVDHVNDQDGGAGGGGHGGTEVDGTNQMDDVMDQGGGGRGQGEGEGGGGNGGGQVDHVKGQSGGAGDGGHGGGKKSLAGNGTFKENKTRGDFDFTYCGEFGCCSWSDEAGCLRCCHVNEVGELETM